MTHSCPCLDETKTTSRQSLQHKPSSLRCTGISSGSSVNVVSESGPEPIFLNVPLSSLCRHRLSYGTTSCIIKPPDDPKCSNTSHVHKAGRTSHDCSYKKLWRPQSGQLNNTFLPEHPGPGLQTWVWSLHHTGKTLQLSGPTLVGGALNSAHVRSTAVYSFTVLIYSLTVLSVVK